MSKDTEISPQEAGMAILQATQAKIQKFAQELNRLKRAEVDGRTKLAKNEVSLPNSATPSEAAIKDGNPVKQHAPTRTVFKLLEERMKKAETFISNDKSAEHDTRLVNKGKPKDNLPPSLAGNWSGKNDEKPEAEVKAPGSGGLKKDEIQPGAKPPAPPKGPTGDAIKPAGIPAAKTGSAPTVPKPPSAAGSVGSTMKSEVGIFKKLKLKKSKGVNNG